MEKGLSTFDANEKLKKFGRNEISTHEKNSIFSLFFSQFLNLINLILLIAAILSFAIGSFIDAVFILIILLLNGFFGFIQEYRAEKSLEKLKTYVKSFARIIRDGKEIEIETARLVPEDIVILSEGDRIPADGKLISDKFLEVDESILTGESLPVAKKRNDEVFSGTLVTKGSSRLKVEKTGNDTRFGQIAKTLADVAPDKTPLQKRLDGLARTLSLIILLIAILIIPIGIFQDKEFISLLLIAVSIGIAAIPEGLPAVVTIALAIGTSRMAKKKAIVRRMQAVETLGSVQIIITDKTGTLTQNTMRVKKFWAYKNENIEPIVKACILGNTASIIEKPKDSNSEEEVVGDKTDGALLLWAKKQISSLEKIKKEGEVIQEYAFDPKNLTVTTIFQYKSTSKAAKHIFVRGAPEAILSKSSISEKEKDKVIKLYESFAKQGLRVIAFGAKTSHHSLKIAREDAEKNLNFLGIVGIYDPPRLETKKSIHEAKHAGISTIMVTGDNTLTASSIAEEIGLLEKTDGVLTGKDIDKMSDEEIKKNILKTRIFARAKPEHKLRLVAILKKMGYVVGVTGDGVNDSLALKRADVGLAMGQSGTDVAKEASDIVLTDDNYATVVSAVGEGRTIYSNIQKSITYLLAGNLSELAIVFIASLLNMPNPLLPTQILWINLVTDGLPALALASDNKDKSIINNKPRDPHTPILTRNRILFIATTGSFIAFVLLFVFSTLLENGSSETLSRTIIFNLLITSHMILAFIVRGKSMFKFNKFLILGVLTTFVLQLIITFNPFFQNIFRLGFN